MRQATLFFAILIPALVSCGPSSTAQLEENKAVVRRFVEAINNTDYDLLDEVMAPDVVRHSQATPEIQVRSRDEFKRFDEETKAAFPDARVTVHFLVAEGDRVAGYMSFTGTQEGQMGSFPPTRKPVESKFLGILRLEGGMIAEMWVEWDNLAMLTQLGHLPAAGDQR